MTSRRARRLSIVGGGFSGLMAAYHGRRRGFEVALYESKHWGGLLSSPETPWGRTEAAANGLLRTESLTEIAREIGLELVNPLPEARIRWIANENPESRPVSWPKLAAAGSRYFYHRARGTHLPRAGETLAHWGERVVGHDVSDRILTPGVQGIYGADARSLSGTLVLSPLFRKGRARRRGFCAPRCGMQEWATRMTRWLRSNGVALVESEIKSIPDGDHVILAVPPDQKSLLLREVSPAAARFFSTLSFQPLCSVSTFWKRSKEDRPGFGILFHPNHGWGIAGVLFENQIFPDRGGNRSERYIVADPMLTQQSDSEILKHIQQVRERLGVRSDLLGSKIHRWPKALPLYDTSLEEKLAHLPKLPAGLHLLGNELGEIGLTSLEERARELILSLEEV